MASYQRCFPYSRVASIGKRLGLSGAVKKVATSNLNQLQTAFSYIQSAVQYGGMANSGWNVYRNLTVQNNILGFMQVKSRTAVETVRGEVEVLNSGPSKCETGHTRVTAAGSGRHMAIGGFASDETRCNRKICNGCNRQVSNGKNVISRVPYPPTKNKHVKRQHCC